MQKDTGHFLLISRNAVAVIPNGISSGMLPRCLTVIVNLFYKIERERQDGRWDLIIAHPPCTDLCVSGARHFEKKRADGRQQDAIDFFYMFINADCDKIAVENPIGIISGDYVKQWFGIEPLKYSQVIQPYEYGHPYRKSTCLWLKNLPPLVPTDIVDFEVIHSKGKSGGYSGALWNVYDENGKALPYKDPRVAKARSKTFTGIAKAMAEQWGETDFVPVQLSFFEVIT